MLTREIEVTLVAAVMLGSGSILGNADPDGVTRRLPLIASYGGHDWAAFWLASATRRNTYSM